MSIKDEIRIKSIRESVGKAYTVPDAERVKGMAGSLKGNEEAWEYLTSTRGLSVKTIEHFGLGYDYERNAISIPILKNGVVVAIKYRFLKPDKFKYGAEKGCESWFYNEDGLEEAKKSGTVIVVEGEFDLMSAWQAGYKNVVSPAQGKNSYNAWIEKLDPIAKVIISYDNDKPGKDEAKVFADKVGIEKSFELVYPDGIKDANEFFLSFEAKEYEDLIKAASPFYTYQYKGLGEVIKEIQTTKMSHIELYCIPEVRIEEDWLTVISGVSNVGKTSYVMNIAKELSEKEYPVLIMPFERGIRSVGQRYLQLEFELTQDKIENLTKDEWADKLDKVIDKPIYFTLPKRDDINETIIKAKRMFGIKAVIIDHLDYMVRNVTGNKEQDIANALHDIKALAIEHGIMMFIVTHIKKQEVKGSMRPKKPVVEDLKGSSSLYQDPECVLLLHTDNLAMLTVAVAKNKGPMVEKEYAMNVQTGVLSEDDF